MGQIVIQIPGNRRRRYEILTSEAANQLLEALESSAERLAANPLSDAEIDDLSDVIASDLALMEIARTGITYPLAQVKAELGL